MYSPKGMKTGCFLGVLVLACLACVLVPALREAFMPYELQAKLVTVNGDPVNRVQMTGKDPQSDLAWSEADKNLDEGYAERTLADAQAEKLRAESCAIRNNCYAPDVVQLDNGKVALVSVLAGIVLAFIAFAFLLNLVAKRP